MRRSIPLALLSCLALPALGAAQDEDEIVRQAFRMAFGSDPVASRPADHGRSPETGAAIAAGRSAVASPTNRALSVEFADRLGALVDSRTTGSIMEILFLVMKESVSEMSEDKEYWLSKLAEQNKMGEALSEYLDELSDASRKLRAQERTGAPDPTRTFTVVPVMVRTFDPVWVDALGEPSTHEREFLCDPCLTTRAATLNAEQVQREQETVLGLQRRLESARRATEIRQQELDRQTTDVIRMLAEVLKTVADREGRTERRPFTPPRGSA